MVNRGTSAITDHWEVDPLGSQVEPREKVFVPEQNNETPVDLKMLSSMSVTIAQFKDGSFETFVMWDWCNAGSKLLREPWTGKTIFRIAGPNEIDYGVGSREIRNVLTDFKYARTDNREQMTYTLLEPERLKWSYWRTIKRPFEYWNRVVLQRSVTRTRHNV